MFKKIFILSFLFLIMFQSWIQAQDSTQLALWEDFKTKYGEDLKVKWNWLTNTPSLVYGQLIELGYTGSEDSESVKRLALNFISENKDLFRVDPEKLICWKNYRLNRYWFIAFYQQYDGLTVHNSKFGIAFNEDMKIKIIGDHYHPDIKISTTPTLSAADAVNIAVQSENITQIFEAKHTMKVIYPVVIENSTFYCLAWKFEIVSEKPFVDKVFFVDAHDGEILLSDNLFRMGGIISGKVTGKVITDGGATVTRDFYDQYVNIVEESASATTTSTGNYSIYVTSGNPITVKFILQGSRAKVGTIYENPYSKSTIATAPASNINHFWQRPPKEGGEPLSYSNVFYFMNEINKFYNNLGYHGWDSEMTATVDPGYNTAAFGNYLTFGYGEVAGNTISDEVYHEYTHNVIYRIFGNEWIGPDSEPDSSQGKAMDEAFPDYFACSKNSSPIWGGRS